MDGGVDVGGVGLEPLPDHQHRLAVGVLPGADEGDVRLDRDVALDLRPDELERVGHGPDVLAAAGDRVGPGRRVERRRSGMEHLPTSA